MENKFCMSCGQQLEAGAKFCPHCGATQPTEALNTQAQGGNDQPVGQQVTPQTPPMQQQTPPVQPNPNMQQGYQQAPQQPGMQERFKQDYARFKNNISVEASMQPQLGFVDSVKYTLANTFDTMTPESRKSVFWWACLGFTLIDIALYMLITLLAVVTFSSASELFGLITILVWIIFIVFNSVNGLSLFAAAIRRYRFVEKSPWWIFMPLYDIYLLIIDKPQPYQPYYGQPQNNDQNTPQN